MIKEIIVSNYIAHGPKDSSLDSVRETLRELFKDDPDMTHSLTEPDEIGYAMDLDTPLEQAAVNAGYDTILDYLVNELESIIPNTVMINLDLTDPTAPTKLASSQIFDIIADFIGTAYYGEFCQYIDVNYLFDKDGNVEFVSFVLVTGMSVDDDDENDVSD